MISSQKDIIETYYEIKMIYLLQTNATLRQSRAAKLQSKFKRKEVEFNDRSIKLLQIFNDSSSQYFKDFKKLLKDDLCDLTKDITSEWEYQTCKKASFNYPQYGIFSTLIFIQRLTMVVANVLKSSPVQAAPFVLGSPTYQDIDMYIIYTVKVFYQMETRIN